MIPQKIYSHGYEDVFLSRENEIRAAEANKKDKTKQQAEKKEREEREEREAREMEEKRLLDDKSNRLDRNGDMNGPGVHSNENEYVDTSKNDKLSKRSLIVKTNSVPDVHLQIDEITNEKAQFETGV